MLMRLSARSAFLSCMLEVGEARSERVRLSSMTISVMMSVMLNYVEKYLVLAKLGTFSSRRDLLLCADYEIKRQEAYNNQRKRLEVT